MFGLKMKVNAEETVLKSVGIGTERCQMLNFEIQFIYDLYLDIRSQ